MGFSSEKFYRTIRSILILLVLLTAFCAAFHTVADYDMGWHLATGRYVIEHHQIPRTDVLSFTSSGEPWAYPPFAGVLFYSIFRLFGYAGLTWFCALSCLGVVAYLVRRGDLGSVTLALLAVQSIAARTTPRADLFTMVFFAIFLGELWSYARAKRSRLWLLPVVMLLWVNLHPGFVAGLAVICAYLLIEAGNLVFPDCRTQVVQRLAQVWPSLALCVAATFANPWGYKIYFVSLNLLGLGGPSGLNSSTYIGEFKSVPISTQLLRQLIEPRHMENGFSWLLVLAIVLAGLFLWKRELGAAMVVIFALYAGLTHARYMPLFAITIVTLGGSFLSGLFIGNTLLEGAKTKQQAMRVQVRGATILTSVLCVVALLQIADFVSSRRYVVFNADWRFGAGASSWFPERATAFIRKERLPGNIFEEYALGGYAAWRLGPEYPDFLDGRGDRLRPDLVVEQRRLYKENPDSQFWHSEADRWNINVLLLATSGFRGLQKLDPLAFCQSTSWRAVYMDDVSMVFLRDTPQNGSLIERLQIDCMTHPLTAPIQASRSTLYDFYLNSGALFFELQRDQESERSLRLASTLYPEDPNAHLLLASLYRKQKRFQEAEQEYLIALELNESGGARYALGLLYAAEGRNVEAIQAIECAAEQSVDPLEMYMTLGKLQLVLNQPDKALSSFAKAEKSSPFRNGGESLVPELYAEIAEGRSEANRLLGRWAEAVAFQQEATRRTPSVASRWERLAKLYQAVGQLHLAAEARQRAAELETARADH